MQPHPNTELVRRAEAAPLAVHVPTVQHYAEQSGAAVILELDDIAPAAEYASRA